MTRLQSTEVKTTRLLRRCAWMPLVAVFLSGVASAGSGPAPPHVIVKYRSQGSHALEACAERLSREGRAFAPHVADGGTELDRIQADFGPLAHRAVFRRARGTGLASETRALRERLRAARDRRARSGSVRGRSPSRCGPACEAELPDLAHVYRVALPPGTRDANALARALRDAPQVEYAHVDFDVLPDQLAPPFDDPFLASEGSWGQPYADLWGLDQIGAQEAWARTLGEGVIVAVVDTGIDVTHPDLAANVWVNPGEDLDGDGVAEAHEYDGIDSDGNGFVDDLLGFDFGDSIDANEDGDYDDPGDLSDPDPFDERGHGTHVAGTIAAVAGNGEGIVGVAPGARVMAVKGFPREGSGVASVLWRAVLYAAENGAHVINNSWSCGDPCPRNELARDVLAHVEALGAVVVTSAGNATADVVHRSPENTDDVLTVGALGFDERLASFSNRGYGVDVVAPGGEPADTPGVDVARRNILSLLTSAPLEFEERFVVAERYRRLAGTSMAAPHVAGAVALLRSLYPEATPQAIREQVRLSGRDLAAPGHDWIVGAGALDLPALLASPPPDLDLEIEAPASGAIVDPTDGPFVISARASGADVETIELAWATGLRPRTFEPLEAFSEFDRREVRAAEAHWQWRPDPGAPGPRMLRVRVLLRDGRVVERFRSFGVDSIAPRALTRGERQVGPPATDGRRVAWPMAVDDATPPDFGVAVGRAQGRRSPSPPDAEPPVIPIDGRVQAVDLEGRLLAWQRQRDGNFGIEWCRVGWSSDRGRRADCDPRAIPTGDAVASRPFVARGWILWQADRAGTSAIEGCHVGRHERSCVPRAVVDLDPSGPRWRLRSFDGETMLLEFLGEMALCDLRSKTEPCTPEPILRGPGTPPSDESVHDGDLIALRSTRVAFGPGLGCLPGENFPGCEPGIGILAQVSACELVRTETGGWRCDAVGVSDPVRLERFGGLAVSGRRLVWSRGTANEDAALFTCEFDAERGRCPRERVGGALAAQSDPDLEGGRLVWRGARDAGAAIWSRALPGLFVPPKPARAVRGFFFQPFHASAGDAEGLDFEVEVLDSAGATLLVGRPWVFDPGPPGGRVWLVGRTAMDREGSAAVRVRARSSDGLSASGEVRIEVVASAKRRERPQPPNAEGRSGGRALRGPR